MPQTLFGYVSMCSLMYEPSEEWVNYVCVGFGTQQISDHPSSFN